MAISLTQSITAVAPRVPASFLAVGGAEPYMYSVSAGGAGGTINASTGVYTAPVSMSAEPQKLYDTIRVVDASNATTTARILVGTPLFLFCDIIQRELELADGRVYVWDQKIMQPTDSGLYVAVSMPSCKPFANVNRYSGTVSESVANQYVSMLATVDIDIISRGVAARDRKEEVILALNSTYAQQQQEINSFYIGKLPAGSRFINLSDIDGAAIPYRYRVSVNLQYAVSKAKPIDYFDDFEDSTITNA